MRILCANKFYFVKGGCERYMFDVEKLLNGRGHSTVPFAMMHPQNEQTGYEEFFVSHVDYAETDPVAKVRAGLRMMYSTQAASKIRSLVEKTGPDVSHLHNIAHQLSPSILGVLKDEGVGTVMTAHDFKLVCPNYRLYVEGDICNRCKGAKYYNAVGHKCMFDSYLASTMVTLEMYLHKILGFYERYLDVVIAPSMFMKEKLIEFGVNESKVEMLRHFAWLDKPASDQDDGFILYAGRLEKEKGVDLLLATMEKASLPLKIAGDGSQRSALESQANKLTAGSVEFMGTVPGDTVAELLHSCSFLVIPSRWYENAPMIVYEALSAGKPVVGAAVGGIPELVVHERTGLLFERGSVAELSRCMELLSGDRERRREMGREARSFAEENLSPEMHVAELEQIYAGTVS